MRRSPGRAVPVAVGLFAVLFLLLMVVSGRTRPTQNLVKFEAAGLMRAAPDQIDRVELTAKGRRVILTRREPGRWTVAPPDAEWGAPKWPPTPPTRSEAPRQSRGAPRHRDSFTDSELAGRAVSHLLMSLKFMHVTAPVRVMSRSEHLGEALGEYGLDPPRYTVSLHGGSQTVLATSFGGKNPQEILQYVRVEGRDDLYLLPGFVGREWELVMDGVTGP